jgi:predicted house-cleaning noncanonical NTP pyrophosphatase (MazG superfamily)
MIDRWEAWGTVFSINMTSSDNASRNYILEASGRLNFVKPIQNFDVYMSQFRPHIILLRYALSGQFTLIEQNEEFSFKPSNERWLVEHKDESFELTDEDVLQIVLGNIRIKDILGAQKVEDLISEESKKALSILSDMFVKNVFDEKTFEEIERYAEEAKDERVKDMLKIVERRFRKMPYSKDEVKVQIIE